VIIAMPLAMCAMCCGGAYSKAFGKADLSRSGMPKIAPGYLLGMIILNPAIDRSFPV
jgi:hypothetical protein